ncbi:hypothetical protein [uncultured Sphingomonas sp.]|uniref:hypothetical protein n=1 Tax=uncultured Sphingomonas sp. TaxID=158754 RepID=UPI0035CB72ED
MSRLKHLAHRSLPIAFALGGAAPAATADNHIWPRGVTLPAGEAVNEDYRRQFDLCDREGTFRGQRSRYTRSCADDPNAVTALRILPGGAVAYVSKLAVDLDGSAFACGPDHGRMDQCPTSLMLRDPQGNEVPVDADKVPYVVIPEAGPPDVAGEFTRLTGVRVGDFGVVIANGRTVPVIVADTGPYSKLGEGSLALHRALNHEQCVGRREGAVCTRVDNEGESITSDVTTVLFPGSARDGLTPANIASVTQHEGNRRWADLQQGRPAD